MRLNYDAFNEETFTPEEVEKGLHIELINTLLKLDQMSEDHGSAFRDIHICSDGYCTIVQWCLNNKDYGTGSFEYVSGDQVIMQEIVLPDDSYQYAHDDEEANEILNNWLSEHPNWKRAQFGGRYEDTSHEENSEND